MDLTIQYYLDDFILENRIDTMVLACTHYPLIGDMIRRMYPDIRIINPSEEIVTSVEGILQEKDMFAQPSDRENVFYASDLSENFVAMIDEISKNTTAKIEFKNLEIDKK